MIRDMVEIPFFPTELHRRAPWYLIMEQIKAAVKVGFMA
jgi:hypothetical protein